MLGNTVSRRRLRLTSIGAAIALLLCMRRVTHVTEAEHEDRPTAPAAGHLEARGCLVTIYVGELGRYYTVRDSTGAPLAHRIPERQLRWRFRRVHDTMHRGHAGNWAGF